MFSLARRGLISRSISVLNKPVFNNFRRSASHSNLKGIPLPDDIPKQEQEQEEENDEVEANMVHRIKVKCNPDGTVDDSEIVKAVAQYFAQRSNRLAAEYHKQEDAVFKRRIDDLFREYHKKAKDGKPIEDKDVKPVLEEIQLLMDKVRTSQWARLSTMTTAVKNHFENMSHNLDTANDLRDSFKALIIEQLECIRVLKKRLHASSSISTEERDRLKRALPFLKKRAEKLRDNMNNTINMYIDAIRGDFDKIEEDLLKRLKREINE